MPETAPTPSEVTQLYRVANPNLRQRGESEVSHPEIVGQWFTPSPEWASAFLRKANAKPGAQLVVAEVPTEELDALHASQHPIASKMDYQGDAGGNYIVPRDGSYKTTTVPLEPVLGELYGMRLGELSKFDEAKRRILLHLGDLAAQQEQLP